MPKNKKNLKFKNIKEEAAFWDKHDAGEILKPVKILKGSYLPDDKPKVIMSLRVSANTKKQVSKIAKNYDLSSSSLIRMWVLEKMQQFAY